MMEGTASLNCDTQVSFLPLGAPAPAPEAVGAVRRTNCHTKAVQPFNLQTPLVHSQQMLLIAHTASQAGCA